MQTFLPVLRIGASYETFTTEMRLNGPACWLQPAECPPIVLAGPSTTNCSKMMETLITAPGRPEDAGKAPKTPFPGSSCAPWADVSCALKDQGDLPMADGQMCYERAIAPDDKLHLKAILSTDEERAILVA